jgi:hypothetical protein
VPLFLCPYQFQHFAGSWKSAQILLGKNELAAMLNLEDSPARLDQIGLDTEFSLQFLRQTGGFGSIISTTAVCNLADLHVFSTSSALMSSLDGSTRGRRLTTIGFSTAFKVQFSSSGETLHDYMRTQST